MIGREESRTMPKKKKKIDNEVPKPDTVLIGGPPCCPWWRPSWRYLPNTYPFCVCGARIVGPEEVVDHAQEKREV